MKRFFFLTVLVYLSILHVAAINYNGAALVMNEDFTRTECGTAYKNVLKEVSGMACSRTTPGYLWLHGDENTDEGKCIIAIRPTGDLVYTVNISGDPGRDDWEDIATGVYNGKNYVFIGAIGDNDLAYKDSYYIYYFEEPTITSGSTTVKVNYIRFSYPDGKAHNTETLMYDNIEQVFYIADKVEGAACSLYRLPFQTNYGTATQKLELVCTLGDGNGFDLLTGGDISPDGKWMAIKNKSVILLWERNGEESLVQTAKRQPTQIAAYEEEKQGESLAWKDSNTFYTTSDQKKDVPIYQYVRTINDAAAELTGITINGESLTGFTNGQTNYNVELPYGTTTLPLIEATAASGGTVAITMPSSLPGVVTIVCTSKDGSTQVTYTINLTVATTALKEIYEVKMTNSYNAYINVNTDTIHAYYLAGTAAPTISTYKVSDGAILQQNGSKAILTGADGSSIEYVMEIEAVEPMQYTSEEIVFDGTETWVKGAYGFDATKKWKFSKTDTDYSRELAGKTHLEMFLPACDTIVLKSMDSKERDITISVNGKQIGNKFTLLKAGSTIIVNQPQAFMLTINSAQSSGDGGVKAIRLGRKSTTTSIENQSIKENVYKVLHNGQVYIVRGSKMYTLHGQEVR